jgi:hypothetical protein
MSLVGIFFFFLWGGSDQPWMTWGQPLLPRASDSPSVQKKEPDGYGVSLL